MKPREDMYPNLKDIEDLLFDLSTRIIKLFAEEHKEKKFYGFGFDVNAEYGEVLLCFNTEEDFQKTAKEYVEKWNYSENDLKELKMNFGDWEYHGINLDYSKEWYPWSKYVKEIQDYVTVLFDNTETTEENNIAIFECEKFSGSFLEAIIRVLIRLENNNVFDVLKLEENFITLVIDHDEDVDEAIKRIKKIRVIV